MNNGIYFSIMDLGRVDMMVRSGLWRSIREGRLAPVVTAETIRFRRPLTLFQRFYVETRVIGWDEKAFLMEQRFMRPSGRRSAPEVLAEAIIRARFLSDGIAVPASHFLALLDAENVPSPRLPEWIARWNERQAKTRDLDRTLIEEAATDEEKPQGTFDHGGIAPI
jgi:acyl-CoA thioesterase FadM